jgi:hypothetical protein
MREWLRYEVLGKPQERCALDEPAMVPTVMRLTPLANVLQHKAQFLQPEDGISPAVQLRDWILWVTTGIMPAQRQLDPRYAEPGQQNVAIAGVPSTEHRSFDHRGLQLGSSAVLAQANLEKAVAEHPALAQVNNTQEAVKLQEAVKRARQYVFDLLSGNAPGTYRTWLAEKARPPLLVKPIRRWPDWAPDLWQIFRSELRPDPGDSAARRFIAYVAAPAITGETLTDNAVKLELRRLKLNRLQRSGVCRPE